MQKRNTLERGGSTQLLLVKVWLQLPDNCLGCFWTKLVHTQRAKAGGQRRAGWGCWLEASCWVPTEFLGKLLLGDADELMAKPPGAHAELLGKLPQESTWCCTSQETGSVTPALLREAPTRVRWNWETGGTPTAVAMRTPAGVMQKLAGSELPQSPQSREHIGREVRWTGEQKFPLPTPLPSCALY